MDNTTQQTPVDRQPDAHLDLPKIAGGLQQQGADAKGDGVGVFQVGQSLYVVSVSATAGHVPVPSVFESRRIAAGIEDGPEAEVARFTQAVRGAMPGKRKGAVWTCADSASSIMQVVRVPKVRGAGLPNAVFWTLRKEKRLPSEGTVLDFEPLRVVEEGGRQLIDVLAVAAPEEDLAETRKLFSAADIPLAGVTLPVFAYRNLLRFAWPDDVPHQCVVVSVNDENTEVMSFREGRATAVRSIRTGLHSLRHALAQSMDVDTAEGRVEAAMAMLTVTPDEMAAGQSSAVEQVFAQIRPAARRLVRNVQRALHAFETETGPLDAARFFVAGEITDYPPLTSFLSEQFGVPVRPLVLSGSPMLAHHVDAATMTPKVQAGLGIALGLALSAAYTTPNLLYTYRDRQQHLRQASVARITRLSCFCLIAALGGAVGLLRLQLFMKDGDLSRLRTELKQSGEEVVTPEVVARYVAQAGVQRQSMMRLAHAFYSPAVISELSALTPPSVQMLEVDLTLAEMEQGVVAATAEKGVAGGVTAAARKVAANSKTGETKDGGAGKELSRMVVRGVIPGKREHLDAALAAFVLALEQSPFFAGTFVSDRRLDAVDPGYVIFGPPGADHVLHFTLEMTCVQ